MVEAIDRMVKGIIEDCEELKFWNSWSDRESGGCVVYDKIKATDPNSDVYKTVCVGLIKYLNQYTDIEIKDSWDITLDDIFRKDASEIDYAYRYARQYAIITVWLTSKRPDGDLETDAFLDACCDMGKM